MALNCYVAGYAEDVSEWTGPRQTAQIFQIGMCIFHSRRSGTCAGSQHAIRVLPAIDHITPAGLETEAAIANACARADFDAFPASLHSGKRFRDVEDHVRS